MNNARLVHDGKFIYYNIIHSPYENMLATKGDCLYNLLNNLDSKPYWVVFVDDAIEQIESVNNSLKEQTTVNYELYYYTFAQT